MNIFSAFYHQRLAYVDLTSGKAETLPLGRDRLEEGIGGPALGSVLAGDWPDALILTAGPYTGSFAPASGHLAVTFPAEDGLAPAILASGRGAWLRRSGFDALVIRGRSASACCLRCRGGQCFLEKAPPSASEGNRNRFRAELLRGTADGLAGLLLADRAGSPEDADLPPAAGTEHGLLSCGAALAPALLRRRIPALVLEGGSALPLVPIPAENVLRAAVPAQKGPLKGLYDELILAAETNLQRASPGGEKREPDIARIHVILESLPSFRGVRHAACTHCPSPCFAWIPVPRGGHLLAADHEGLLASLQSFGEEYAAYLGLCDARGLDPVGSQSVFAGRSATAPGGRAARAPSTPTEEMRLGLMLGICPRLIRRVPALGMVAAVAFLGGDMAERIGRAGKLVPREVHI